jgi:pimeloyl-ACP methyl ester carboxylesterase
MNAGPDREHHFAEVNGLRMHWVSEGGGSAERPCVVLLHGFPETWWSWRYQMTPLARAGYRVLAPDLRGFGETEPRGPYDMATLATDVVALLDRVGAERACLVGHDWGAAIAWTVAGAETSRGRIDAIATLNGPHPLLFRRALLGRPRQTLRSAYVFFFQLPLWPERTLLGDGGRGVIRTVRGLAVDPAHFGDEELAPYREAVLRPGRAKAMIDWYRALPRAMLRASGHARRREYAPAPCPALVLWGLDDRALGFGDLVPGTEAFAPRLEVRTLPRAGHFVHEERPEEVNRRLIDFLDGATAAPHTAARSVAGAAG